MRVSKKHKHLADMFNVSPDEIKRIDTSIYIWGEVWFEVVTERQRTASNSHYAHVEPYYIRQLGNQSKIRMEYKDGTKRLSKRSNS